MTASFFSFSNQVFHESSLPQKERPYTSCNTMNSTAVQVVVTLALISHTLASAFIGPDAPEDSASGRNLQSFANNVCSVALGSYGEGCTCTVQVIPPRATLVCDDKFCELCLGGCVDFCVEYSMTIDLVPRIPFGVNQPFVVTRSRIEERQFGRDSSQYTNVLDFYYDNNEEFQRCDGFVNGVKCRGCSLDVDPSSLNEGCFTVDCGNTGIAFLANPVNFCDESTLFNLPLSHPFAAQSRQSQLGFELCLDPDSIPDPPPCTNGLPPKKTRPPETKSKDKLFASPFDQGRGGLQRHLKYFRGA